MYSWLPAFSVMSHPYRLVLNLGKNVLCEEGDISVNMPRF